MFVPSTFSLVSVSAAAILFGLVTFEQPPRGVPGNALPRLGVRAAAATTSSVRESADGRRQPPSGARNAIHRVPFNVV